MSQSIKLAKLKEAPAKVYKLNEGIILEKKDNDTIILSSAQNSYKTIRVYESSNPNILGTIEVSNNPEYSTRINLRENSNIAVDPSKNNSAILFKQPKQDFVGSYVIRPSMASFIQDNIAGWKENLKITIDPAYLDDFEEQAREYLETNKVSTASFDCKVGEKTHRLTFKVAKSADLKSTVNDINSKKLNRTEPLTEKQEALIAKYNALVEAEKQGKVIGLSISLGDRELRHSFWNPTSELGGVEHTELQKKFRNAVKVPKTAEQKDTEISEGDVNDILE